MFAAPANDNNDNRITRGSGDVLRDLGLTFQSEPAAHVADNQSTAARKDVQTVGNRIGGAAKSGERKPLNALPEGIAGTQAPPVDTFPRIPFLGWANA